jgi:hypothetical protein
MVIDAMAAPRDVSNGAVAGSCYQGRFLRTPARRKDGSSPRKPASGWRLLFECAVTHYAAVNATPEQLDALERLTR